jgi:HlyD family secretion protein
MAMGRKKWLFVGIGVIVAVMIVANLLRSGKPAMTVEASAVKRRKLVEKVSGPAQIQPKTMVRLSARGVSGKVEEVHVMEGDYVDEGQVLVRLESAQLEAQLKRAQANLATTMPVLERKRSLFERNLISREELDAAEAAVRMAEADVRSAQDYLDKAVFKAPLPGVVTELNVKKGESAITGTMNVPGTVLLTVADLSEMEAQAEIDETDVVKVAVGQEAEVEADALPDTLLPGKVTEISNAATVRSAGSTEQATNFLVKVLLDQPDPRLRPGMSASVDITTAVEESCLAVPLQAVVARKPKEEERALERAKKGPRRGSEDDEGGAEAGDDESPETREDEDEEEELGVFIIEEELARFVPIRMGISDDKYVQIVAGVAEHLQVVEGPLRALRDLKSGTRVKAKEDRDKKGTGRRDEG